MKPREQMQLSKRTVECENRIKNRWLFRTPIFKKVWINISV